MHTLLIVDDELNMRLVLQAMLQGEGYDVKLASDGMEALQILKNTPIDSVITDLKMPRLDGMTLLNHIRKIYPGLPVIMITAYGTVAGAVDAVKKGAFDYITKPFEMEEIKAIVKKAVRSRIMDNADYIPEPQELGLQGLIGSSPVMEEIYRGIKKVAGTTTTVLITGETGTGKGLIAKAIHMNSPRANNPFIKINCAAIAPTLMESELFGYEKGAFTGAQVRKPGKIELAHQGTLFLDEIGELPKDMQVKLLRVIQENEFERVGGLKTIKVDIRLIAATNRDLAREVKSGNFREDLFYRLNIFPLHLPPLRERPEDIDLLTDFFLEKFNQKLDKKVERVDPQVRTRFHRHTWPGNVRELENLMERLVLLANGDTIGPNDIPPEIGEPGEAEKIPFTNGIAKPFKDFLKEHMEKVEKDMIKRCLETYEGNVTLAAKQMGISRKGLQIKMIKYNLRKPPEER